MTGVAAAVVQVVGRPSAAEPVTATARGWRARLERLGAGGAVVDPTSPVVTSGARLLVHSVDGGDDLEPLLPHLQGQRLTLVHHGSAPGSDRTTMRALRPHTGRALAADALAREELRALGFGSVDVLDPALAQLEAATPDPVTVASLAGHPGPRLLHVGPLRPASGIEPLLSAMSDLLTSHVPGAVLTLCGPSPQWFRQQLHRTITRCGMVACEVVAPADDGEVVARLDSASCLLALRPRALDPFVRAAADRGLPVVGPRCPELALVPSEQRVEVPQGAGPSVLTAALREALGRTSRAPREPRPSGSDDARLLRALGVR
jgi:hypothetical protein